MVKKEWNASGCAFMLYTCRCLIAAFQRVFLCPSTQYITYTGDETVLRVCFIRHEVTWLANTKSGHNLIPDSLKKKSPQCCLSVLQEPVWFQIPKNIYREKNEILKPHVSSTRRDKRTVKRLFLETINPTVMATVQLHRGAFWSLRSGFTISLKVRLRLRILRLVVLIRKS